MEAMIDNGEEWLLPLLEFRDLLVSTQDPAAKSKFRESKRRDGRIWNKQDGSIVPGPYKPQVCRDFLRRLLEIQKKVQTEGPDTNAKLILDEELHEIRRIWRTERQDWEDSVPAIYRAVMGQDLDWVRDDVASFTAQDNLILQGVTHKHNIPPELVAKLLDLERDMQGMSRRAGINDKIDQILKMDWPLQDQRGGPTADSDAPAAEEIS
jgi:DNA sulfur modification protein DndC